MDTGYDRMDAYEFMRLYASDCEESRAGMLSERRPLTVRPVQSLLEALAWLPRQGAPRIAMSVILGPARDPADALPGSRVMAAVVGTAREAYFGGLTLDGHPFPVIALRAVANRFMGGMTLDDAIARTVTDNPTESAAKYRRSAERDSCWSEPPVFDATKP
jgi:hypothetical protein